MVQTHTACVPLAPARTHHLGLKLHKEEKPIWVEGYLVLNALNSSFKLHKTMFFLCTFLPKLTLSFFQVTSWKTLHPDKSLLQVLLFLHIQLYLCSSLVLVKLFAPFSLFLPF